MRRKSSQGGVRFIQRRMLVDQYDKFFALDSGASVPHIGTTSQITSVAGSAKLLLQASPDVGLQSRLTPLISTSI